MNSTINLFSFDLDFNPTSNLEDVKLLLDIQNNSIPIQLTEDIALEIDTNPYDIQLVLINNETRIEKDFKFSNINITEALHEDGDFHWLLALFIKYLATINNNKINQILASANIKKGKKKVLNKKYRTMNSIFSTNFKVSSFTLQKSIDNDKLRFSFKYILTENSFVKIPSPLLTYLAHLNVEKRTNKNEIDIKSIFNKNLESYTLEANKTNEGIDAKSKQKLYPLVLYSYQEKTVNWIVQKENEPFEELTFNVIKANPLKYLKKLQLGYIYLNNETLLYNTITNYIMSRKTAIDYIYSEHLKYKKTLENGNLKGYSGIIAEDMSLGKTVEIISAIILNKLTDDQIKYYNNWRRFYVDNKEDAATQTVKKLIKSNLVVCTDMILKQWVSSFSSFSDTLNYKVFHYTGFKGFQKEFPGTTLNECAEILSGYEIVITSYSVLKNEVPYVEYADNRMNAVRRTRTKNEKVFDYSSPLCSVTFFRAIFDESQSLSQASLSSLSSISRIHTWAISATPLKYNDLDKNISELANLLRCLQIHPFDFANVKVTNFQSIQDWVFNKETKRSVAEDFINTIIEMDIARRHTRDYVQKQLNIPKQHKFLLPVYLTPIEREVYNQVYDKYYVEMHDSRYYTDDVNVLNNYLTDLTTMCMAALGIHDYRRRNGIFHDSFYLANQQHTPEDSMSMILSNLLEANKRALALELRRYIDLYVQKSRYLIEKESQYEQSEPILLKALKIIDENIVGKKEADYNNDTIPLSLIRHSVVFFLGDCYYNLGLQAVESNNVQLKQEYEKKENTFYEEAAKMRKSILQEQIEEVENSLSYLKTDLFQKPPLIASYSNFFTEEMEEMYVKNILYMGQVELTHTKLNLFLKSVYDDLEDGFDEEVNKVNKLYNKSLYYISKAVDEQIAVDGTEVKKSLNEIKFEAFKSKTAFVEKNFKVYFKKANPLLLGITKSIKTMNKQITLLNELYFDIIALLSIEIIPVESEEKDVDPDKPTEYETSLEAQQDISFKIELIELILSNRRFITLSVGTNKFVVPEHFKAFEKDGYFITNLKDTWYENYTDFLNYTAIDKNLTWKSVEFLIDSTKVSKDSELHTEWRNRLKELNKVFNKKINYYKSLQQISDKVIDLDSVADPGKVLRINNSFERFVADSEAIQRKLKSKDVYLSNLATLQKGEDNKCLICLEYIETGSILECGHRFCRDCIQHWLKTSSTCALCKMPCSQLEVHDFYIDLNPNDVGKQNAKSKQKNEQAENLFTETLNGYKVYDDVKYLSKLKVPDSKYGSKVNVLLRLLKFIELKDEDSGYENKSQIIIYTRFPKIIPSLERILSESGFKSIVALDNKMKGSQIDEFKKDKTIRVLIMTTNDNAGLTLVNANVLILFDPILQTSVESQAINRISRIGQNKETYVFNFVTMNTVEENIIRYKQHLLKQSDRIQTSVDTAASSVNNMSNKTSFKRSRNGSTSNLEAHSLHVEFLKNCLFNDFKQV